MDVGQEPGVAATGTPDTGTGVTSAGTLRRGPGTGGAPAKTPDAEKAALTTQT